MVWVCLDKRDGNYEQAQKCNLAPWWEAKKSHHQYLYNQINIPDTASYSSVKTWVGLLTETPKMQSSLGHGTWPQLMFCALVAVQVPEAGRGRVGASEQGDSSDDDQDSE